MRLTFIEHLIEIAKLIKIFLLVGDVDIMVKKFEKNFPDRFLNGSC